jgi:hypothetical protein
VVLTVAVCLISMPDAFPQSRLEFEFGVRMGAPINQPYESHFFMSPGFVFTESIERPKFTVGPTFSAVLFDRVLVEFDALRTPIRFTTQTNAPFGANITTTHGSSWTFPLVIDYRFLRGALRPYGGGGMVLGQLDRNESGLPEQAPAYVVNTGLEWKTAYIMIRPELRYTHWDDSLQGPRRKRNQFEFLVGFSLHQGSPLRK